MRVVSMGSLALVAGAIACFGSNPAGETTAPGGAETRGGGGPPRTREVPRAGRSPPAVAERISERAAPLAVAQ
jgi:hypothetical protein